MKKYIDLINETAEETAKTNNELIAKESNLSLQSEMLNLEKSIAQISNQIESAKKSKPLNISNLMELNLKLKIAEKKLEFLKDLSKELF